MSHNSLNLIRMACIAAFLLVFASACRQGEAEPTATASPAEAEATAEAIADDVVAAYPIAATAWELEFFGPPEERLPMLPDTRATVVYFWDRYAGFDGCNWFLGVYGADTEGVLRMQTPSRTPNYCTTPAGIDQQAATYGSSLLNTTEYEFEGEQLLGYTVDDQLLLTFSPALPVPILDAVWELKLWWQTDREAWAPVIPTTASTLVFAADGEASGSGGCNDYTVSYEGDLQFEKVMEATDTYAELPTITFGSVMTQQATCAEPEGIMEQEAGFFNTLGSVGYYFKLGGALLLLDAEGMPLLMLAARN
jgi:heat shock protein HslJ